MIDSRSILPALLCLGLAAGCSSSSGPTLAQADGTVNYQGRPLAGAIVVFVPEKGPIAMGVSDQAGKFVLSTGGRRGAMIGPASVTVTATAAPTSNALDAVAKQPKTQAEADEYMKKAAEMQQAMAEGRTQEVVPTSLIPEKYGKTDTSGLKHTVDANSSKNHFTIDL